MIHCDTCKCHAEYLKQYILLSLNMSDNPMCVYSLKIAFENLIRNLEGKTFQT